MNARLILPFGIVVLGIGIIGGAVIYDRDEKNKRQVRQALERERSIARMELLNQQALKSTEELERLADRIDSDIKAQEQAEIQRRNEAQRQQLAEAWKEVLDPKAAAKREMQRQISIEEEDRQRRFPDERH